MPSDVIEGTQRKPALAHASRARPVAGIARRDGVLAALWLAMAAPVCADPLSVTVVGGFQTELGCTGNYDANCLVTRMTYTPRDQVWRLTREFPAGGPWGYFYAIDGAFSETYSAGGDPSGATLVLSVAAPGPVRFFFRYPRAGDGLADIADSIADRIVVASGDFQDELGCPEDGMGDCLQPWLLDMDGDGTYRARLEAPRGNYTYRFALDEQTLYAFGQDGEQPGAPYEIQLDADCPAYDLAFELATRIGSATCVPGLFHDGFEPAGSAR
jgi:pullulanase